MIEDARIFLLDLNPSRGLGKELQGILESSSNFDIRLEEKPAGTSVVSCCRRGGNWWQVLKCE